MGPFLKPGIEISTPTYQNTIIHKEISKYQWYKFTHWGMGIGGWDVQLFPTPNIKNKIVQGEGIQI